MSKQVLILNITRMGDLVQMTPLLQRLEDEWPGVAIDLIVDTEFSEMAQLLPGIRTILSYDFQALMDDARVRARDLVTLYKDLANWAEPLVTNGYDRVINLTFNRRSAYLTGYVKTPDVRGLTTAPDGSIVVKNAWMAYFLDMHTNRNLNRFNLVDVYALGGSGSGSFRPVRLKDDARDRDWGSAFLRSSGSPLRWVGVQVGASDVMKAWRPGYFGETMALLSQRLNVGFVLIGTKKELPAVQEAIQVYKKSGGQGPLCNAIGKTSIPQLVGLLSHCDVMLTNDTGPMHLAVGVGVPIVNVSVGHVDFRETGPYGANHWVIQPDIECGPCGFDQVCAHQSCKERLLARSVSDVCLRALKEGELPQPTAGMRVYESELDEDGLGTYQLCMGAENQVQQWYGKFWRKFWYEDCLRERSRVQGPSAFPPDLEQVQEIYARLAPLLHSLCEAADELVDLTSHATLEVTKVQACHARLQKYAHEARVLGRTSPAYSPITAACFRETFNLCQPDLHGMAREHASAYTTWMHRTTDVIQRIGIDQTTTRRMAYASSA